MTTPNFCDDAKFLEKKVFYDDDFFSSFSSFWCPHRFLHWSQDRGPLCFRAGGAPTGHFDSAPWVFGAFLGDPHALPRGIWNFPRASFREAPMHHHYVNFRHFPKRFGPECFVVTPSHISMDQVIPSFLKSDAAQSSTFQLPTGPFARLPDPPPNGSKWVK